MVSCYMQDIGKHTVFLEDSMVQWYIQDLVWNVVYLENSLVPGIYRIQCRMLFIQKIVSCHGIHSNYNIQPLVSKIVRCDAYGFSEEYRLIRNIMVSCDVLDLLQNLEYPSCIEQYGIIVYIQDLVWSIVCLKNSVVSCISDLVQNIVYLGNDIWYHVIHRVQCRMSFNLKILWYNGICRIQHGMSFRLNIVWCHVHLHRQD